MMWNVLAVIFLVLGFVWCYRLTKSMNEAIEELEENFGPFKRHGDEEDWC